MSKAKYLAEYKQAQKVTSLTINGRFYDRLRFEAEDSDEENDGATSPALCGHCEVPDFSYHLLGCEEETCPRCRGQIISCLCEFEQRLGKPPLQ